MATINQGSNAVVTIPANQKCVVTTNGAAEIDVMRGATVTQTINLANADNRYEFKEAEFSRSITIYANVGTVSYDVLGLGSNPIEQIMTKAQSARSDIAGVAGVDAGGNLVDADPIKYGMPLRVGVKTLRGVAHRGGWPNANTSGRLFGASVWDISPCENPSLVFVGATQFNETLARTGTLSAKIEIPLGSGNWVPVTFGGSPNGTFSQAGTVPSTDNNFCVLESDGIPYTFTKRTRTRVVVTGIGGLPTMLDNDGRLDGKERYEFTMQDSGGTSALDLSIMTNKQISLVLDSVEQYGGGTVRPCTDASYNSTTGVLTLTVPAHALSSSTLNKLVLDGFVSSGASVNGVYDFSLSGPNQLTINNAPDPSTFTEFGVVRQFQSLTSAAWANTNGGQITFTRAGHGYSRGDVISLRGSSTLNVEGVTVNGDYTVISTPDSNTYIVAYPVTISGSISVSTAFTFRKYLISPTDFHLRPYTIVGNSNIACVALAGDSTTQSVDAIDDNTYLCGVLQNAVGERYPFIDLSANGEGLNNWVNNPTRVLIREELIRRYAQGIVFGFSKNDESTYGTDLAAWTAAHEAWWDKPAQAALKNSPVNMVLLAPSRVVRSVDEWTTMEGQTKPAVEALIDFHRYLKGLFNDRYHHILKYFEILTERNQPYTYKTDMAETFTFTTTAGSSLVTVSGSTLRSEHNGRRVMLKGAALLNGVTTQNLYGRIKYLSSTSFILFGGNIARQIPVHRMMPSGTTIQAVTNGVGVINIRKYIDLAPVADAIHENPDAIALIRDTIALKP